MKKHLLYSILTLGLCCTACSMATHEFDTSDEMRTEVRLSGSILKSVAVTRVSGNDWEADDQIGVFMYASGKTLADSTVTDNASNCKYRYADTGGFSPATEWDRLYYPATGQVDFIAYYPFGNVQDFKLRVDVSDQRFPEELDLLYSDNLKGVEASSEAQNLVFEHCMSKVVFTVSVGDGISTTALEGLSLTFRNVATVANLLLPDGTVESGGQTGDITVTGTVGEDDASVEAIMIPQNCEDAEAVLVLSDGTRYLYTFASGHEWENGKCHNYLITLSMESGSETELEAEITNWDSVDSSGSLQGYENKPWEGDINTSWYSLAEDNFSLVSPEELAGLAKLVNEGNSFSGKSIRLLNNLDMNGLPWVAIGHDSRTAFSGTFDGDGHKIQNLCPAGDTTTYVGLFGYSKGVIEKVMVEGTYVVSMEKANLYIGGVCGTNDGVIRNCRNYSSIDGEITLETSARTILYAGGIVAVNNGTVSDCQNYGILNGNQVNTDTLAYLHVGGIAGGNTGSITGCENTCNVTATNSTVRAGGIAGLSTGASALLDSCTNWGDVIVTASHQVAAVGGVVGRHASEARVKNVVNNGAVSVTLATGTAVYGGGVAGMNEGATLLSGINKRTVEVYCADTSEGTQAMSGGAVGYNTGSGAVHQVEHYGTVTSEGASVNYMGGITGYNDTEAFTYSCCTNSGYPSQWVGNADSENGLVTETEHEDD